MEILNRTATIEGENVVIVEETKVNLTKDDLLAKTSNIQRRKARLLEENNNIIAEFNQLATEEAEYNGYLAELETTNITPAIIE